jgi:hypothetical protein
VGTGDSVCFWEYIWLGDTPLAQQYPSLYNIVQRKNIMVATVLAQTSLNITLRRTLNDYKSNQWLNLCQCLMEVELSNDPDKFVWKLNECGVFKVKSMYLDLMQGHTVFLRQILMEATNPSQNQIFMWFLNNKVLLTMDNLVKRN